MGANNFNPASYMSLPQFNSNYESTSYDQPITNASNQYGAVPNMPSVAPGAVPQQSAYNPAVFENISQIPTNYTTGPGQTMFEEPLNPGLNEDLSAYLQSQIGQGVTPFNLATPLATGGSTQPGQVNAPMNPVLSQLQTFLQTGYGGPAGTSTLQNLSQTGEPIDQLPAWQAMVNAEQQNIQQNEANLKEQFASTGGLSGSEFGNALSNYEQGTTATQNAALTQAETQAQQQAVQNQLSASTTLSGLSSSLGQVFQGMDQQDIQNLMQEFLQTNPDYSPLLNLIYSQANTYAPIFSSNKGTGIAGTVASLAPQLAASAANGISAGSAAAAGGSGTLGAILAGLAAL